MIETTTSDSALARLEAEIAGLKSTTTDLEAKNARLTAALATPAAAMLPPGTGTTSRRGMLRQMVAASAAATMLAVSKDAVPAEAAATRPCAHRMVLSS
jgi:hypothetical protein